MTRLSLFLLGLPRLELDGQAIEIDRRKATALLAYLAVTGQAYSRDSLATLFWPDYDQSRARGALRRTLSVLNTTLGNTWFEANRETVALSETDDLWIDVGQFRQYLTDLESHKHTSPDLCSACVTSLTNAISLYQDDFLAGFTLRDSPSFDDWQFFQSENLRRDLAGALEQLVRYHCAQQAFEPAITYARRWLELDNLHEPTHQLLMQLYAQTDQRAAALRQYQECVRILEEELDTLPTAETTALYEQIKAGELRQAPETVAVLPAPAITRFSESQEVPPPAFLSSPPTQPEPLAPFVARDDELGVMDTFLQDALTGQGKIMFVTGEAGSGKTALVHEFAQRAQAATNNLIVASGNCNAHTGPGDPYLPFREILSLLTGDVELKWNQGLITQENINRLWALIPTSVQKLVEFGPDLMDVFVPNAALLTRTEKLFPGLAGTIKLEQRQRHGNGANVAQSDLFEQFTHVLQALSQQQPLILIIDDAQWADAASINLLFHLGRQLAGNHILLAVTYRSDDVALGRGGERHPLEAVVNELKRIHGDIQLDLDRSAGRPFVEALLDTQSNQFRPDFGAALFDHTQGHPLFTLELLWGMYQRGDVVQDEQGRWVEGPSLNWKELPVRVEAVIKERLDRLDGHLREILTIASVEGGQFTAQVVTRLQNLDERQLLRELSQELEKRHRLIQGHGEIEVNDHYLVRYRFNHTLFQHYLYNSLGAGERRLLHGEIAQTLETLYAGQTDQITVRLARHYTEAGQAEKAVAYLLKAGDRARNLYDNQAAADYYQKALVFLKEQGRYAQAAQTLMKLGLTYHLAFQYDEARKAYEEGFSLWRQVETRFSADLPPAPHPLRLLAQNPSTLDPTMAMDEASVTIINKIFSGLVNLRPEMEVVPDVARRWEVIDGYKYIFHLRKDVFWSDGVPVTAADFAYAWRRVLDPVQDSPNANLLYDVKNAKAFNTGEISDPNLVGVYAEDEHTLIVELESPTSYLPHLLTYTPTFPLPRHAIEKFGEDWVNIENLVTNGPFKIDTFQPNQILTFSRNPSYHGQFSGNVELVEIRILDTKPDITTNLPLEMYENNELDVVNIWSLPPAEMAQVQLKYCDDYRSVPGFGTRYIGFDLTRPPFDDVRVRRALAMAVNIKAMVDVVMGEYAFPATGGFVPQGMPGYSADIGLPYDPEQARQLLTEAGYPNGHGFPAVEWVVGYGHTQLVEYLQSQWHENLNINIPAEDMLKDKKYYDRLSKNPPHMHIMGWVADYPDPDNFLRISCVSSLEQWQNKAFNSLIEEARQVRDQNQRMKLYQQADKLLVEDVPIISLFYPWFHFLVKPWVTGYPTSPIRPYFWEDTIIEPH